MKKLLSIILLFSVWCIQAQDFKFPGEITINNQTISGNFNNRVNPRIITLQFKASNNNEVIDLFESVDVTFSYSSDNKTYITKSINESIIIAEILILGRASLYKNILTNNFIIENDTSGLRVLQQYEDFVKTRNNARGILAVIFEDCAEVRSSLNKNRFTYASIKDFTENYNKCGNYNSDYTFSDRQLEDLEFSKKKGIVNVELGASYLTQQINFNVPEVASFDEDLDNFSIFANVNFSPSYFKQLRRKLFFDIGIALNFQSNADDNVFDVEKNSVLVNVSPRYNFLPDAKVNPFIRTNFVLAIDTFSITENVAGALDNFGGNIDETDISLVFSIEAGIDISRFRISLFVSPNYNTDLNSFGNSQLIVSNQSFGFKAAYILGKK